MENKPLSLIIEDDLDLSVIFSEALNAAGFEAEIIRNGQQGLDRLKTSRPNVVILDMHLPQVSGDKILEYIRSDSQLSMTNVVVVTADALMAEQVRDLADFVLIKPISFGQLRDLTARLHPTHPEH